MSQQTKWLPLFLSFIEHLEIDSKEIGRGFLGENLYDAQLRFLTEVCEGLDRGIRHFVCLKARQLGISTISLAMDLFWLFVHPGLQGALITDDDANRDKFRIILSGYLDKMPKKFRVGVKINNKNNLVLANGSVLDYLVAGKRKGGNLGISRALNFVHATEVSRYGDPQGLDNLMASLAETYPHRLYIFESTAHGPNAFMDMWKNAGDDPETQKRFFIGWWAKETYSVPRNDLRFERFWDGSLSDDEIEHVAKVKKLYGVDIKPEQIVWFRWNESTHSTDEGANQENYPWYADEAWVMTGEAFFPGRKIMEQLQRLEEKPPSCKAYRYHLGDDFLSTEFEQVTSESSDADLYVWEEPDADGFYVVGVDPDGGRSDYNGRHSIEVFRCYADRMVQVAEYVTRNPETYAIAWVLFHLAGAYRNCMINLEIFGPGHAIMQEKNHLKQLMDLGYLKDRAAKAGLFDVFGNVRWYLYHRPDSTGGGYAYNSSTTEGLELTIMNQLRDSYALNHLVIRSPELLEEMQLVTKIGAKVGAEVGGRDGRVFSTAFANKAWIEWIRPNLIALKETWENVQRREADRKNTPNPTMTRYVIANFFAEKEQARVEQMWEQELNS